MTTANTLNCVERACAGLHHDGKPITFTAVAARTGLGRTTLYRNPTLRTVIEEHRHRSTASGTLAGLTDEIATLRTALDAYPPESAATKNNSGDWKPETAEALTGQQRATKIISRLSPRQRSRRNHDRAVQDRMHPRRLAVAGRPADPLTDLEENTSTWLHWYNTSRLMHRLGRRPPAEAEAEYYDRIRFGHPAAHT